jgi:hypothetical protein
MQLKIKTTHGKHVSRMEADVDIKEIMVSEDIFSISSEGITIGFAKGPTSGILVFSQKEFDKLAENIRKHTHLIKGIKYIK